MSSLRLALKQSLEETGGATIGSSSSSGSDSDSSSSSGEDDHHSPPHHPAKRSPKRDDTIHPRGGSSHSNNSNNPSLTMLSFECDVNTIGDSGSASMILREVVSPPPSIFQFVIQPTFNSS